MKESELKLGVVLSLFDGMSCGQIALNRSGISYQRYYSSEIDSHAIKVTQHHYPNTIQLGSVLDIKGKDLPQIDLLIGGSPCQGFSFSGKQLNFEDPRSKLFFEFVRLVKECKPKYWLLENVVMKKQFERVITEYLGVEPIKINSSLVSAQNRERLYWANFPIEQPIDRGIKLPDILEDTEMILPGTSTRVKVNSLQFWVEDLMEKEKERITTKKFQLHNVLRSELQTQKKVIV